MIYSYACPCGHKADKDFPFRKAPRTQRCACGKRMERVVSYPAVIFRGPGFAKTTKDFPE
jgi:predicted nucleic acid-binding Zn ribbon protein